MPSVAALRDRVAKVNNSYTYDEIHRVAANIALGKSQPRCFSLDWLRQLMRTNGTKMPGLPFVSQLVAALDECEREIRNARR